MQAAIFRRRAKSGLNATQQQVYVCRRARAMHQSDIDKTRDDLVDIRRHFGSGLTEDRGNFGNDLRLFPGAVAQLPDHRRDSIEPMYSIGAAIVENEFVFDLTDSATSFDR
jgi:hypothetical protein